MTGKAQIDSQSRQVAVAGDQVQSTREAQSQVIAVKRNALDLLEYLRQVYRGTADFLGNIRQRPATRQTAGQDEFDAVPQPPPPMRRSKFVRGARTQATTHQSQRQALSFQ